MTTPAGVILYGPPASGKDTVTAALHDVDPSFQLFHWLMAGPGHTTGYRLIDRATLSQLRAQGALIWENDRDGATFAIDAPALASGLAQHHPVLHVGHTPAITAVRASTPAARWVVVQLWCARAQAVLRLRDRGSRDLRARLRAWDETEPLSSADLDLDTGALSPAQAAAAIVTQLAESASHTN